MRFSRLIQLNWPYSKSQVYLNAFQATAHAISKLSIFRVSGRIRQQNKPDSPCCKWLFLSSIWAVKVNRHLFLCLPFAYMSSYGPYSFQFLYYIKGHDRLRREGGQSIGVSCQGCRGVHIVFYLISQVHRCSRGSLLAGCSSSVYVSYDL